MTKPIVFTWDGDAMVPHQRFASLCDRQYVVGESYTLVHHEERSDRTHRHFFASVNEIWKNLPEQIAARWPTPEHLRKWALIRCGYADSRSVVCESDIEAHRIAAFLRPLDAYAVIAISGPVVTVYTAQSQSRADMNKATFQQSKEDVFGLLADLIGTSKENISREAERNAEHHGAERLRSRIETGDAA